MPHDQDHWISQYKAKDALWIHSGDSTHPHALLTSGKHSDGFFNSRLVIPDEALLCKAAIDLLALFTNNGGGNLQVDVVVGPQTGATKLAELMSEQVQVFDPECLWASPAKGEENGVKTMCFTDEERKALSGKSILLCEDVLTTGGSVTLAADAVAEAGGILLPYVLVLVNRSGLKEVDGKKIVALVDRPMPMWAEEECPLCKDGSEAVRPKDNWERLSLT